MDGPEVAALEAAPLKAEEPSGEEVDLAEDLPVRRQRRLTEKLPSTATPLPLIGLLGLLSLGMSFVSDWRDTAALT